MPFTKEQQNAVTAKLTSKIKLPCPSCGVHARQLVPDIVLFALHVLPAQLQSPALPCVAIICMNCGHTIEAAAMLGVSRQFLVGLLEKNEIPYHMVGTHRRIYAQDLVRYKVKRDRNRGKIIDGLAQLEAEEGLYAHSSQR